MPEFNTINDSLFEYPDYISSRNEHFKEVENRELYLNPGLTSSIHRDSDEPDANPTIGYGYNLNAKSLAQNTAFFTHAFGTLTETQVAALQLLAAIRS